MISLSEMAPRFGPLHCFTIFFFALRAMNRPLPAELTFRENTGLKVVRFFRNLVKYC